ncbi:MAG: hypothetical protein EOP00_10395 [Pedobacter sp.]|nr:MAG: hypothetical protein EOP00_10395 [Pedobacter sp.]
MKKLVFTIILVNIWMLSFSQDDKPIIKKSATTIREFVPAQWKVIAEAKGDLNKDGLADVALVIENTNSKNLIIREDQKDTLNTNPRMLLVFFKKSNGTFELVAKNTKFIPSEDSKESPCLTDPFGQEGGIEIAKGLLQIHFQNFYSCGAWEIYNFDYTFRFQNQKFELIGYNKFSMHRSSGEETSTTMNFSTMKMNYTSGTNAFKDGGKAKTFWKNIKPRKLLELNSITEDAVDAFDY